MKIAFIADAGSANTKSWVEHFADELGHEIHVVSVKRGGSLARSVHLHQVGPHTDVIRMRDKIGYVTLAGKVRAVVRAIAPDLVVGYRVTSNGFLAALTGFHPFAVAAQSATIIGERGSAWKKASAGVALRSADLVNSWAPHMTRVLVSLGADPDRILTVPRGVDVELFSPNGRAGDGDYTVVTTRMLDRYYKTDVIVRALALARAELPGVSAAILGNGEAASELRRLAQEIGVADRAHFPGAVAPTVLASFLRRSAIYVSAIGNDGVSASLLEAMACGCFPIARDNEANRHWVEDGANGFLVATEEPADYAQAIVRAWTAQDLRSRAATVNRAIVLERGSLARNMKTIEGAYLDLVERFGRRGSRRRDAATP